MRRNPSCKYIYIWNKFWKKNMLPQMGFKPTSPWLLVRYVTTTLQDNHAGNIAILQSVDVYMGFPGQFFFLG